MIRTQEPEQTIPVFPLGTVLFPDGVLPLRIFEARYMDMVRDCLKNNTVFGVCLITEGAETGNPAAHEPIGCTARIDQWDMQQLGLLNIRTIGVQRFEILNAQVRADGLKVASVQFLAPDADTPIPDELGACVTLLERVVDDLVNGDSNAGDSNAGDSNTSNSNSMQQMIQTPCQFESASWVSNRLCELLPFAPQTKHELMLLDDPLARLNFIHEFLCKQ